MSVSVEDLARQASQLANVGRWAEAENLWREVYKAAPQHPQALFSLGVHALQRGDAQGAQSFLERAAAVAPNDLLVLQALARAHREAGNPNGELQAIERSLVVDAYFLPGLLARANFLERHAKMSAAATAYRNALIVAPPEAHWPDVLRPQLQHARTVVERHSAEMHAFLSKRVENMRDGLGAPEQERWSEALSIMSGRSKPYLSDSNQLAVPRLPAIPFFDRAQFPWARAIEAKTDIIREELKAALAADGKEFQPYIAYRPGDPVNQWKDLNHSTRWSAYQLYRGGVPVEEHLRRCPQTAAALAEIEMADIGGLCPNAMFSALAPHTQIPPHHGETNARLVVHLPLIVPEGCTYRVGFEYRKWRVGELLIFDDTIEHEARNDSDELRVVLIFDVWNPLLNAQERDIVRGMAAASRDYAEQN